MAPLGCNGWDCLEGQFFYLVMAETFKMGVEEEKVWRNDRVVSAMLASGIWSLVVNDL